MASNLAAVCDYYADLLLLQYKWRTRARANIRIYTKQALGDLLIQDIDAGFNLDTATGAQLDILGKYVGVPRDSGPPEDLPYYGFWDYTIALAPDQNGNGMKTYTDAAINAAAVFFDYSYFGTRNTDLTDTAYSLLIKLKIILNSSDGTLASIQQYLQTFFPGLVSLQDNADMTMVYTIQEGSPVPQSTLKAYLPKPMGVGVTFVTMTAALSSSTATRALIGSAPSATVVYFPPATIDVAITNGVGPYSYSWQKLSDTLTGAYATYLQFPGSAVVGFQRLALLGTSGVSTWRCIATDSRGLQATSGIVTVTLDYHT